MRSRLQHREEASKIMIPRQSVAGYLVTASIVEVELNDMHVITAS